MILITIAPLSNNALDSNQPYGGSAPNRAPELVSPIPDQNVFTEKQVTFDISGFFSDPDGDPLTFSVDQLPAGLSIDSNTGIISGTTGATPEVVATTVTATDPGALFAQDTFNYTVEVEQQPAGPWPRNGRNVGGHYGFDWEQIIGAGSPYRDAVGRLDMFCIGEQGIQNGTQNAALKAAIDSLQTEYGDLTKPYGYDASVEVRKWGLMNTNNSSYTTLTKILAGDGGDWLLKDGPTGDYIAPNFGRGKAGEQFAVNVNPPVLVNGQTWANWYMGEQDKKLGDASNGGASDIRPLVFGQFIDAIPQIGESTFRPSLSGTISSVISQKVLVLNVTSGASQEQDLENEVAQTNRAVTIYNSNRTAVGCEQIESYDASSHTVTIIPSDFLITAEVGNDFEIVRAQGSSGDYTLNGQNDSETPFRVGIKAMVDESVAWPSTPPISMANASQWYFDVDRGIAPPYPNEWVGLFDYVVHEFYHTSIGLQVDNNDDTRYIQAQNAKLWGFAVPENEYLKLHLKPDAQSELGLSGILGTAISRQSEDIGLQPGEQEPLDYAFHRFGRCFTLLMDKMFYGPQQNKSKPVPLDELYVKLGDPVGSVSLTTFYDPVSGDFTVRDEDQSGQVYWQEYDEAIIVCKLEPLAQKEEWIPSHLPGGQPSQLITLPDPGAGKKWQRFNSATYVNPDTGFATLNQDPTFNDGSDVTTVNLGRMEGIMLLRVNV